LTIQNKVRIRVKKLSRMGKIQVKIFEFSWHPLLYQGIGIS